MPKLPITYGKRALSWALLSWMYLHGDCHSSNTYLCITNVVIRLRLSSIQCIRSPSFQLPLVASHALAQLTNRAASRPPPSLLQRTWNRFGEGVVAPDAHSTSRLCSMADSVAADLITFLNAAPTPFHAVRTFQSQLSHRIPSSHASGPTESGSPRSDFPVIVVRCWPIDRSAHFAGCLRIL